MDDSIVSDEVITTRLSRLNQLFAGKTSNEVHRALASREGLLDALIVLYDECKHLPRNKYVEVFLKKCK